MTARSDYVPVLAVVLSIAVLSAMDAFVKELSGSFGTAQITMLRYLFGLAFALPFAIGALRRGLSLQSMRANGFRGLVVAFTAFSFFEALGRLPLAFAVTIAFTAPLWTVVLSHFMLNEPITRRSLVAIAMGLSGVAIMVFGGGPGQEAGAIDPLGVIAAMSASVGYALAIVLLRRQSAHDTIPVLVTTQALVSVLVVAPFGIGAFQPMDLQATLLFLAVGATGTAGHFLMAWGFKLAPATRLAPIEYTTLLWATLFGFVFFGEKPGIELFAGAALIVAGSLIVARKPRRRLAV